jgi:hypothetical protein
MISFSHWLIKNRLQKEITTWHPIDSGTISSTRLRLSTRADLAFSNFKRTESPVIACIIKSMISQKPINKTRKTKNGKGKQISVHL